MIDERSDCSSRIHTLCVWLPQGRITLDVLDVVRLRIMWQLNSFISAREVERWEISKIKTITTADLTRRHFRPSEPASFAEGAIVRWEN